jgi:hypothetical protein
VWQKFIFIINIEKKGRKLWTISIFQNERSKRLTRRFLKSSQILIFGHTWLIGVLYGTMADMHFPTVLYFPQALRPFLNTGIGGALSVTTYTSLFSRSSFLVSYPSHKNVFTGNSCRNWCQKLFCNNTLPVTTASKCKPSRILTYVVSSPDCGWACKRLLLDFN